ncbi:MAG: beta-Ala-His dipeptidase, partial [Deltaproteobacteria bacterium]|nr:beta-Ala-His dipeptidase [Deltaproteobacteria bacterium]
MESAQFQEASPVFAIFEAISAIPRGSGNEAAIAAWLLDFARTKGWQGQRDAAGNVLLRVAGSTGRETHKPLVVQAHMDMVCEKLPGSAHDFKRDPLRLGIDGDWLRAEGTTLGADDGIGMALALALAQDKTLHHPPLELLFTVQEETNLVGAQKLDASLIRGRRLLNIDSETEGIFTIGCAGGRTSHLKLPLLRETAPLEGHTIIRLSLGGLQGGHSGMDIGKGRGNANKLLARALALLAEQTDLRLLAFQGGSRSNVIPDRAEAVVAVADPKCAAECIASFAQEMTRELDTQDTTPHLTFEECVCNTPPLVESCNAAVLRLLAEMPDGVHQYEENGLIRTSNNCAIVSCEGNTLRIESLQRSSQTA